MEALFAEFRKDRWFFEDIIAADYDSEEKAKFDQDDVLVLAAA